jgi:BirA family transcriptional regulator, biotin operon repressor / biotin---[acetyl-CoA-carboxylase] ligase
MPLFFGTTLLEFGSLPSTNTYANQLLTLAPKPAEGTVVVAQHQTAGRGQMGNTWATAAQQNLTLSVILYPHFVPISAQFVFNQAVALGIRDAIERFSLHYYQENLSIQIKWSNDILIKHQKVCGVLIENTITANALASSVVGIGINVNQTDFEGLPNATSLKNALLTAGAAAEKIDLFAFRQMLLESLEARYLQLRAQRFAALQHDYLQHLYRYGEDCFYKIVADNSVLYGRIVGVSAFGKLQIQHTKGIAEFATKEIVFL